MSNVNTITQGMVRDIPRQVVDRYGQAFTSANTPFLSSDALATKVWRGNTTQTLVTPTTAWLDATIGTFQISFSATDTASLDPGVYRYIVTCTRSGDPGLIDRGDLIVQAAPGSAASLLSYTVHQDLYDVCSWIDNLRGETDEEGFQRQQWKATEHLIQLIVDRGSQRTPQLIGQPGFGPSIMQVPLNILPSKWLRDQITPLAVDSTHIANADNPNIWTCLIIRSWVREYCARTAVAYVLSDQIASKNDQNYWELAAKFRRQARSLLLASRAEIDLGYANTPANPTGWPSMVINFGNASLC